MALILTGAAAYAAYAAAKSAEETLDPEIDLENKTAVEFLPIEVSLGLLEAPFCTISFFEGNYKTVAPFLEKRTEEILCINPWLGGWIAKRKGDNEVKLWYGGVGDTCAPSPFRQFEPGEIPLFGDTTPYVEYEELLEKANAKVPKSKNLIGKNESIWRVTIIAESEERFALVVSMSHFAGDAHTFYMLYSMLSQDTKVVAMSPVRRFDVDEAVGEKMGKEDRVYIKRAITNPFWEWTRDEDNPTQNMIFYVSEKFLQALRDKYNSDDSDEGMRLLDQTLIAYWWFSLVKPTVAFQTYQLRTYLEDCDLSEYDAGNYMNPIPFTEVDYAKPEDLQRALPIGRRCGTDPPSELPGFKWDATFSTHNDMTSLYTKPINLGEGVKEKLHLLYHDASDVEVIPSKLSMFGVFVAYPGDKDGSNRRIGAFVNAPKSLLLEVEASGIVDGTIAKF